MCSTGHQNLFHSLSVLYNNISFLFLSHLRCIAMPMTHNSHWKKKLIQRTLDKHDCTTQCNIQTWDHHFQNFNGHSDTLQLFLQAICPIRVPLRDATDPIYTGYSSLANGLFSSGWLEFHAKKLLRWLCVQFSIATIVIWNVHPPTHTLPLSLVCVCITCSLRSHEEHL